MKYLLTLLCVIYSGIVAYAQGGTFYQDFDTQNVIDISEIVADLPAYGSFVAGLHLRYPEDWVVSEVNVEDVLRFALVMDATEDQIQDVPIEQTVTLVSPEMITAEILASYIAGEDTPPMLTITYPTYQSHRGCYCDYYVELNARESVIHDFPRLFDYGVGHVQLSILTDEDDWKQNEAMYQAMLRFPSTFEYYLHEDLQHSLFSEWFQIGFPEGWIETMPDNIFEESVYFVPEDIDDMSLGIELSFLPQINSYAIFKTEQDIEIWFDEFVAEYGIDEESQAVLRGQLEPEICALITSPLRFENNEAYGYLISKPYALVKLSANHGAEIDKTIIDNMVESLYLDDGACG